MHFVQNYVGVHTKKIIMYSIQYGGQNRNIKMVAFCTYMVMSDQYSVTEILVTDHS